jgi:hypothetical protein
MADVDDSKRKLFVFSIDSDSGRVVKFESVDFEGRHELTEDEKATLIKERPDSPIETLLEQAFEAGIACVVGNGAGGEAVESRAAVESEEDSDLHRLLLEPLIEDSAAARLMRREVLGRAIIQSLIVHSLKSKSGGSSAGGPQCERAGSHHASKPTEEHTHG